MRRPSTNPASTSRSRKGIGLFLSLTFAASFLAAPSLRAQSMSLQDCIDYALEHNTSIQQQRIAKAQQEVALSTARSSRLPTVTASVGQGWGFGRSTARDGSTVDQTSASTSFNVGASVPIFTGFRIPNQIKSEKFSLQAASANLEKARRDVGIQVATSYLNALYYKGLADVQRRQLELDRKALETAQALYETGRQPRSEVATAEAQVAVSQHGLTDAVGNETLARLDLMQMLNIDASVEEFSIQDIDSTGLDTGVASVEKVFAQAVENHPSILAARYNLESSRYDLKATRSGYMPSLSFNASYSNSYYHLYNSAIGNTSFGKQLDLNGSEYLGLSLNIPIFDAFSTRNSMRRARLNIENQTILLTDALQTLRKDIQTAYWNAIKARENYASACKANASTSLAYDYEAEKHAAGKSTGYTLQQAATKMQKARQDEVQAKYEYLMRIKILEFYNSEYVR